MSHLELKQCLVDLRELLASSGCEQWLAWTKHCIRAVDSGQINRHDIRSVFGGMGSFNDVVIQHQDEDGRPSVPVAANERLDALRRRIWTLSEDLPSGR